MGLPNSNISVSLVKSTIGSGSNDVGTLCTHPNINKWSRWKPVRLNKVEPLTEADLISVSCGLSRASQSQDTSYEQPRGGASDEPYRLADFRNYNHAAAPPVNVQIVKVGEQTTPPYSLIYGNSYFIEFRLSPGDINPTWINPETSRIKNTDPEGGYGGISWITGPDLPEQDREPEEVFSCVPLPPDAPTYGQWVTPRTGGGLRLQYCRYEGDSTGKYKTTFWRIEDDGYDGSYRSLFTLRNVSAGIGMEGDFTLSYLLGQLAARIPIFNNEPTPVNVRITLQYERIETGITYNFDSGIFSLASGYNSYMFFQPLTGWGEGLNTYEIRATMYFRNNRGEETQIAFRMETASIFIETET